MAKKIGKRDLATVRECLALGIPLNLSEPGRPVRNFSAGSITDQINPQGTLVKTTHLRSDMQGSIWLNDAGVSRLAAQARELLARKDEVLAGQERARQAFLDR